MTVLYENPHDGNFILSEDDEGRLSRDNIVIASKKLVKADVATFDPAKSYEVEVRKVVKRGTLTMRPAFNPYVVSGAVAAEIVDSIRPDTVRELAD